jgi:hypothetical protein
MPLTVPERTTHTHANAAECPGLLRSYDSVGSWLDIIMPGVIVNQPLRYRSRKR